MKVANNILELIGNTPLVKLNKLTKGSNNDIFAKLEYFNPGGSVKDRIGIAMIEKAEKEGKIKPGCTIIEPTSGNTGTGLALASMVKGYKIIFTIPDKMSKEKIDLLRAYGAKVLVTPTNVSPDDPKSYYKVAETLSKEIPNSFIPNQYFNSANPEIHYETTGKEIWEQTDGEIDILVAGMGTGGTITGTGKYLKEKKPEIRVIGVDPEGSIFHHEFYNTEGEVHTYKVEGIGEDFMPSTLDLGVLDEIITVKDEDAFLTTRRLAREEGILAGGSSGAAVFAALKVAKNLKGNNKNIVVILPDTGRNYMDKIYSDEWMLQHKFLKSREERISVKEILKVKSAHISELISISPDDSVSKAVKLMNKYEISQLPVIEEGIQVGSISEISLMKKLSNKEISLKKKIREGMDEPFPWVNKDDTISDPFLLLKEKNAVLIMENNKIVNIITTADVIKYLSDNKKKRDEEKMKFETKAVRAGEKPERVTGAISMPIYQTATYVLDEVGKLKGTEIRKEGFDYSRTTHPTRVILENKLNALEGGNGAIAFSSGMAAITALMHTLKAGDHVVFSEDIYGGTYRLLTKIMNKFNLESSFVDLVDLSKAEKAIKRNTKMVFIETPTNPLLKIYDIKEIAKISHEHQIPLVVDNTFMTPYFQRPFELGADTIVHSLTKYLAGHNDLIGGAVISKDKKLVEELQFIEMSTGPLLGPFDSWLTLRGIKTLALRMEQHDENGRKIAQYLEDHKKVTKVIYPGLKSHPQHELAKKQMSGFGGMISFEVNDLKAGKTLMEKVKLWALAESLGGVESLITHPATMTHASLTKDEREARGIKDGLIRLSIGIEHHEDLINDLKQALDKI